MSLAIRLWTTIEHQLSNKETVQSIIILRWLSWPKQCTGRSKLTLSILGLVTTGQALADQDHNQRCLHLLVMQYLLIMHMFLSYMEIQELGFLVTLIPWYLVVVLEVKFNILGGGGESITSMTMKMTMTSTQMTKNTIQRWMTFYQLRTMRNLKMN